MLQTYLTKNTGNEMSALELVGKIELYENKSTPLKFSSAINKAKEISV